MKIRNRYSRGVLGSTPLRGPGRSEGLSGPSRTAGMLDRINISNRGVEIRRARLLALAAPEVRQTLVDELVGQIRRGEYEVRAIDVASKMIREHLADARG